jgi:hypothetical protein
MMMPFGKMRPLRILLRQAGTELYLQPSGEWTCDREAAQEFDNSVLAYFWAKEQKQLGTEVLLAYANPADDFVAMRA